MQKKRLLRPWQTICLLTAAGVMAACEPMPPTPKAVAAPVAANAAQVPFLQVVPVADPSAAVNASPLHSLKSSVGTYPSLSSTNFLEQGVLAGRLKALLGKDYVTLLRNLRTVGPLQEDQGRWFITGNRTHEGGREMAAVVVDAVQDTVRVWMLHEGRVTQYQDSLGATVPWPAQVQLLQQQARTRAAPLAAR